MSNALDFVFDNVAVSVTDLDRSVEWYGRIFGFTPGYRTFTEAVHANLQILERPGMKIELLSRQGAVRNPDADTVAGPHLEKSG